MRFVHRSLRPLCVAAVTLAAFASPLLAQSTGASIDGTVRDNGGAPVSGATITIVSTATNEQKRLTADDHGNYTVLGLAPGSYRMTVTANGFRTYEQLGIKLDLNQHATQDVALILGDVQQVVSVNADVTGLDTVTATVSDEVNGASLRNLPLNARNPTSSSRWYLASRAAPVTTTTPTASPSTAPGRAIPTCWWTALL